VKPENCYGGRRQKKLSIALATICPDGLVLCGDREIGTPDFKFYQTKLTTIPLAPERGKIVLGYAGSPADTMKVIYQGLRDRLENQDKGRDEISKVLQETLDAAIPQNAEECHQLLCGFCDSGTFHLLKTYNRSVSPVPVWDCVGFGDSALTRYLGAIFLEDQIHLPIYRAVPVGIYLVAQAKKYVQGCGGPTDLLVLPSHGLVIEMYGTTMFDAACDLVEKSMNVLLTAATSPEVTTAQCQQLIEHLRNVLESQSKLFTAFLRKE
jgi:hypothetical protein